MSVLTSSLRYFTGLNVEYGLKQLPELTISCMGHRITQDKLDAILAGDCPKIEPQNALQSAVADIFDVCASLDVLEVTQRKAVDMQPVAQEQSNIKMPDFLSGYNRGMH